MAKLKDIIAQLQAVLPKYTDYFNDKLLISSVVFVSGTTWKIETTTAHGLQANEYINIEKVLAKNEIVNVTDLGNNKIKLETIVNHDLTFEFGDFYDEIHLSGFTNFSGNANLLSVETPKEFIAEISVIPTGTGFLDEDRIDGINGRYEITVIDSTNFTISVPDNAFSDFFIDSNSIVIKNIRVSGFGDPNRFIEYYSKQEIDDFWCFVANGDAVPSFDRNIFSDATQRKAKSDELRSEIVQPFFVYVIVPTTNKYGAMNVSDDMIDIRTFLCKALVGVQFDSGFLTEEKRFLTTYNGDNFFSYVGAYYVHQFSFETVYNFNPEDGVDPANTSAFRSFEINIKLPFDEYIEDKKQIKGELP